MDERDRETFERFARRLDPIHAELHHPARPDTARTTRARATRPVSKVRPLGSILAVIAVIVAVAAVGSVAIGQGPSPTASLSGVSVPSIGSSNPTPDATALTPSQTPSASPIEAPATPIAGVIDGCQPSALDLHEGPYVRPTTKGYPFPIPVGMGRTVVDRLADADVRGYQPIAPRVSGDRVLGMIAVLHDSVGLIYASAPIQPSDTRIDLGVKKAIAMNQGPVAGRDGQSVLDSMPNDRTWSVPIGPYVAALVHGDEIDPGIRQYSLYWSDGSRDWIVYGNPDSPNEMVDLARSLYCDGRPEASPPLDPVSLVPTAECQARELPMPRCVAVVQAARQDLGVSWSEIKAVHLDPDDPGIVRTTSFVANVRFVLTDGSSKTELMVCGIGGQYSPVCSDHPEVMVSTVGEGYWDVPCTGEAPDGCATPLPTIGADAAAAVALRIPSRDYQLTGPGPVEIELGRAVLPNGILSEATFRLADPTAGTFTVESSVRLEVRPVDPTRPPFDNGYKRGWSPNAEDVAVYVVMDVTWADPGAVLEIRDVVVR